MKTGDIVELVNLDEAWGKYAIVTRIHVTKSGTGQIHLIAAGTMATIPLTKKNEYIKEVTIVA